MKSFLIVTVFFMLAFGAEIQLIAETDNTQQFRFELGEDFRIENGELKHDMQPFSPGSGAPELGAVNYLLAIDSDKDYSFGLENPVFEDYPNLRIHHNRDDALPGNLSSEQSTLVSSPIFIMRGQEYIALSLRPFEFDEDSKNLRVLKSGEISVSTSNRSLPRAVQAKPASRAFEALTEGLLLNPASERSEWQSPALLYICGGNASSSGFFNQLVDWRRRQGFDVTVVSTSQTGSYANNIRNYIQNAYDNWDNPPEYVTFVGDVGGSFSVPTFYESWSGYNGEGDHYYGMLDGSDIVADVILGRLSVRNSTELAVVVNKIISYEHAVYTGNNWFEKAAMCGDVSSTGISAIITNQVIGEIMEEYDVEDVRYKLSGGNYATWMRNQLSEGVAYFHYRGYYGVSGFDNYDIENANNGFMLPFATVITCGTGSFASSSYSLSEKFLNAGSISNPKGAIASIGTATTGTHTVPNNAVDYGIWHGLFVDGIHSAGGTLARGKLHLYQSYPSNPGNMVSIFSYFNNLMGDAASQLWTDTPSSMNIIFPSELHAGSNQFVVQVLSGAFPLSGAIVTLSTSDTAITFETNSFGQAIFDATQIPFGEIDITVWKNNYIPVEDEFDHLNDASANLVLSNIEIDDSNSGLTNGNGDGQLNAGEWVRCRIPLQLSGLNSAQTIVASMTSTCGLLNVENHLSPIEVPEGDSEVLLDYFYIQLEPSVQESIDLQLSLTITSSDYFWEFDVEIPFSTFELELESVSFNGSNIVQPGDTVQMDLGITNSGSFASFAADASLDYESYHLEFINDSFELPAIEAGGNQFFVDAANFVVDPDVINGSIVEIVLNIQFGDNNRISMQIPLQIATVSQADPVGPDAYGYHFYDDLDNSPDPSPGYNWIELNPNQGGTGTDTGIDDDGNNQDETHTYTLPFSVRFYGEDYNQISICSNGWVAFGETDAASFRNYTVPGPGGPNPLVAVFWDDLVNDNGSIFYDYDAGLGAYIVQWDNVQTYQHNDYNTFELIIYDNNIGPLGDNDMKFQYQQFNNTSNGSYSYYTPTHGCYTTIGLEDETGQIGLEYTFDGDYPTAALALENESAIYLSTQNMCEFAFPAIQVSAEAINVQMATNSQSTQIIQVSNVGDAGSNLLYNSILSPFPILTNGGDGYFTIDNALDESQEFTWEDISDNGTELVFPHNDDAAPMFEIPFAFPFYDNEYSWVLVNPNGWVGFGNDTDAWSNTTLPNSEAPNPALLGFWDDLRPENQSNEGQGTVLYFCDQNHCVVEFNNVAHYSLDGEHTFQIHFSNTGDVSYEYLEMNGYQSATIGLQSENAENALQVSFNEVYAENGRSCKIKPEANWLSAENLNGQVEFGESASIQLNFDTSGMDNCEMQYYLYITWNSGTLLIPIILTVTNDPIMMGDLDGNNEVNVLDVVLMISFILEESEPTPAQELVGDINEDGELNVLDVVNMVDLILSDR